MPVQPASVEENKITVRSIEQVLLMRCGKSIQSLICPTRKLLALEVVNYNFMRHEVLDVVIEELL